MVKPTHTYIQHLKALADKRRKLSWNRIRTASWTLGHEIGHAVIVHHGSRY